MRVVLDKEAEIILSKFNLNIYNNINGIIEFLFSDKSNSSVNSVFIFGKSHNVLELVCNDEKKCKLLLQYKNDFFEDSLILEKDHNKFKYEFCYDKNSNCYLLNLVNVELNRDNCFIIELSIYGYGNHINIYLGNKLFSFDIQGKDIIFDLYKFEELCNLECKFNLVDIFEIIKLCVDMKFVDKILVDEYQGNKLLKNMIFSENNITKARVLIHKKEKC